MAPKRKAPAKDDAAVEKKRGRKSGAEEKKGKAKPSAKSEKPSKASPKERPAKKVTKKKQEDTEPDKAIPVTDASSTPDGLTRDKRGRLVFKDHPEFKPTLTPKQVIQAGSFGGIYFNPKGGRKGTLFPDGVPISADDFPKDWFEGLEDDQYKGLRYDIQINKYKVKAGQTQGQWEEKGWIKKDSIDKRGWFQWYCNFIQGRRSDDDKRQISRWTGVTGPKGRWKTRLFNLVKDKGGDVGDATISPVIRQSLLHWAYELTPEDYEAMLKGERY